MSFQPLIQLVTVAGLFIVQAGCNFEQVSQQVTSHETETEQTSSVEISVSADAASKLAQADRIDGEEDHVIKQCYSCALAMSGKQEHSLRVDSYEAHFCTQHCCENFAENAERVIASTTISDPSSE